MLLFSPAEVSPFAQPQVRQIINQQKRCCQNIHQIFMAAVYFTLGKESLILMAQTAPSLQDKTNDPYFIIPTSPFKRVM